MLVKYLGIISIFNFLILSIYLFFKSKKHQERNRLLATIVFLISFTQYVFLLFLTGEISNFPIFAYTDAIAISAVMPFFYIYLNLLLENKKIFTRQNLIHLIPIVPGFFYWVCFLALPKEVQQISIKTKSCGNLPDTYLYIISSIVQISYCILSLKKLNGFFFSHKSLLSKNDIKELNWHFILVYGFFILSVAFISLYLIVPHEHTIDIISTIILDLLFVFILVFLLNRSADYTFDLENIDFQIKGQKYVPKSVQEKSLPQIIENEIKTRKLYLQNVNLSKLSKQLSIPEYKISQCINQEYKMTVPDFINFLRIELAKEILAKNVQIKMDFLASECGFSTRTSFYNAFKKFTNTTPSQFKGNLS